MDRTQVIVNTDDASCNPTASAALDATKMLTTFVEEVGLILSFMQVRLFHKHNVRNIMHSYSYIQNETR